MIYDAEFIRIVQGLVDKMHREKVAWKPVVETPLSAIPTGPIDIANIANPFSQKKSLREKITGRKKPEVSENQFILRLPESMIAVGRYMPTAGFDYILIVIFNAQEEEVARWKIEEDDVRWQLVEDLYSLARGQVVHSDKVFDDIHRFIGEPAKG